MAQHTTAVFENGGLRLVKPLEGTPEHSVVELVVESVSPPPREDQLAMLRQVPVANELADAIEAGRGEKWNAEEF